MKFSKRLSLLLLFACAQTLFVFGENGIVKPIVNPMLEIKQIQKEIVQITGNFPLGNTQYYIIEKSLDNIVFNPVTIVFAASEEDGIKSPVILKDKTIGVKKIYYRVKTIEDNSTAYSTVIAFTLH